MLIILLFCSEHTFKELTEAQWKKIKFLFEKPGKVERLSLRQWSKAGLFEKLLRFINADASNSTLLEMDSTFCKVHHVIINERMHVLNVVLTDGHIHLEELGAVVCIPDKSNFKMKHKFAPELYKQRNIVEQFFQRIKNYRRVAFRFDKLAGCFLNFILLASTAIHF